MEIEDTLYVGVNLHCGQWTRLTGQLQLRLFQVVQVEVCVACGVDEVAHLHIANLCHHLQQQGIRRNVERYAQERVGTALVELQRQATSTIGQGSGIELENGVAGGQGHLVDLCDVPC